MTTATAFRIGKTDTWIVQIPLVPSSSTTEEHDCSSSPMALHFVIDNSGSMGKMTEQIKKEFSVLVDSAASRPCSLTLFDSTATLQSDTLETSQEMARLPRLRQGMTNIPQGVRMAVKTIVEQEQRVNKKHATCDSAVINNNNNNNNRTHHVLVLLTDGQHNSGPEPDREFPKIGMECRELIPNVQLSVVVVGFTRHSSTSMGMKLKTCLETVPFDSDSVENIYFATNTDDMKRITKQMIEGLNHVSKGRMHTLLAASSTTEEDAGELFVSEIGAPPVPQVQVRTHLEDSSMTVLLQSKDIPHHLVLDGRQIGILSEEEPDYNLMAEVLAKHIDKARVQRVAATGGAETLALRSSISQINNLIDAMETELKTKGTTELTLAKANGADRLAQNRFITKTLHQARELRNQLAEVVNFTANSSAAQATFLTGRKCKFASKALRRAAVRSGDDMVLDPEKMMATVHKEVTQEGFSKKLNTLLRSDVLTHMSRLSGDQTQRLKRHVKAVSKTDYLLLLRLLKHEVVSSSFTSSGARNAAASPAPKVHTSALCWIPPDGDVHDAIQSIRKKHDRQINRWPPHVNLLYPFVPVPEFEGSAKKLAKTLGSFTPFDVTMKEIDHFTHSKKSHTAWIRPEQTQEFAALQSMCQTAFPHCNDLVARGVFVPHLTVGQCTSDRGVEALLSDAAWKASTTRCGEVCLISRKGQNDPFEVHWRVQLGNPDPVPGPAVVHETSKPNMVAREKTGDLLETLDRELLDFLDSGSLAGYLNEVFFGERKSYLSLSSPWDHIAEWRDLAPVRFESQWEMLLYAGSLAYPITVQRGSGTQMNPFQLKVTKVHTTAVDTASLCCANHSQIDTYGPEGGEPIKDALVLVDPSCPRASNKIASSKLLGETFTSVVVSRDLHMYTGASMKIALLGNALFRCLQPESSNKSKTDAIAEIRRQFLGKAYQCGACGTGPVDHGGCSDLFSHHGESDSRGVASNACPFCGWFSSSLSDWEPWDGSVPETLIEERSGSSSSEKTEIPKPLAAKMDLVLRIVYSFRRQFCHSQNAIKGFYDGLAQKLVDWETTLTTQDDVEGLVQILLAAMACDTDNVEAAFAPPVILAIVNEACARVARKKFRIAAQGDEVRAKELAAQHVTTMLGVTAESAPTTTESLLESEPSRADVEEGCSRDYIMDSDSDREWVKRIAKRWCTALMLAKAFRASLVRRGGGWKRLEEDMETATENYGDVILDMQNAATVDVVSMCDMEERNLDRTLTAMAAQAYLYNKGSSRQDLPDVRSGDTLRDMAREMRMRIYFQRVSEKMAQWSDQGELLAFHKARAADIGQFSSMITSHVHGLSKEMFWGLWNAAMHDGYGGEKVRAFLETANEDFIHAHVGNGELTGRLKKNRRKKGSS